MLAQEWWNVCVNMVTVESDVRGNHTSFASSSLQQTPQPSNLFTFLVFFPLLRCAFGYYGNPMVHGGMCKPCNCKKNGLNMCDSLTGGDYLCNLQVHFAMHL